MRTRKLARDPAVKLTGTIPSGRFGKWHACQLHHLHLLGSVLVHLVIFSVVRGNPSQWSGLEPEASSAPVWSLTTDFFCICRAEGKKKKHGPKSRLHVVVRSTGQNELSAGRMQKENVVPRPNC